MAETDAKNPILVLGATGYIGGRLVPRLLDAGYRVRAGARNPGKLRSRPWAGHDEIELVQVDVLDRPSLERATEGCRIAYYLVHSMQPKVFDFARTDRQAARNLAATAEQAGLERIIYLSGLGEEDPNLSHHLRSRAEVAEILSAGKVPATVLRAAMIIGSGSASFEILRYLVDRLPVMITPRWIDSPCQPIGVRNVLQYLIGCLECPATIGETFDIGQPEVVTYRNLMEIYAQEAGLRKRLIIPVPVLTPRLSSYWIHLITPVPAAVARPLAEGLRNPVVCGENRIRDLIPLDLFDCRKAIRLALERLREQEVESSWIDAGTMPAAEWSTAEDPRWAGGTIYHDGRRVVLAAPIEETWRAVSQIGGTTGWYYADWMWRLRGFLDRLVGGVGLSRGRRDSADLRTGDALDFWRVFCIEKPRRLLLVAEMKVPGQAVLEFQLSERRPEETELLQIARFLPRGLWGILYWFAVYPFHGLIFNGMLKGIAASVQGKLLLGPERLPAQNQERSP